jgi:hypothetical protein
VSRFISTFPSAPSCSIALCIPSRGPGPITCRGRSNSSITSPKKKDNRNIFPAFSVTFPVSPIDDSHYNRKSKVPKADRQRAFKNFSKSEMVLLAMCINHGIQKAQCPVQFLILTYINIHLTIIIKIASTIKMWPQEATG